jgi:hypothetical protein
MPVDRRPGQDEGRTKIQGKDQDYRHCSRGTIKAET